MDIKVTMRGETVAEAPRDALIEIEGNLYFPPSSIAPGALQDSPTPYTCPWKGECQYHHVVTADGTVADGAWSYPTPMASAIERVGRDFAGYVAFDKSLADIG